MIAGTSKRKWVRTVAVLAWLGGWTILLGAGCANSNPYGIVGSELQLGSAYTTIKNAGFAWNRIFLEWDKIQPHATDGFNWNALQGPAGYQETAQYMVDNAANEGFSILVVLDKIPNWALDGNIGTHFAAFASAAVNQFKTKVAAWEIINEPNCGDSQTTEANYRNQILPQGFDAIRAADPAALIVAPALMHGNPLCSVGHLLPQWWLENRDGSGNPNGTLVRQIDVLSLHTYEPDASKIQGWLQDAVDYATARSIPQVWDTEFGFGTNDACLGKVAPSLVGGCINIVLGYMNPSYTTLSPRLKRSFVYKLSDRNGFSGCDNGLMDTNGTVKPWYSEVKNYITSQTWWQQQ